MTRYYDPTLGRFIQPDTIVPDPGDPQSLNRYSYAGNNPVRYTDPSGHCIPDECPGAPDVSYPGEATGLRGEAYAQWLYNYLLWIDRERAATGGIYPYTSEAVQLGVATELNAFLMDDPEMLGEALYQELVAAAPQMTAMAAGAAADMMISGGGQALRAVRKIASEPPQLRRGRLAHRQLGAQYLQSIPEEQRPFVDVDQTFVDPVTGKRFRPDVVNHWTGEIVEYKPRRWQSIPRLRRQAEQQAARYADHLNQMYRDLRVHEGAPEYWWRVEYYP